MLSYKRYCNEKKFLFPIAVICLAGLIVSFSAGAESWAQESVREFEELRLRQLQTVQNTGKIAAFTTDGCSGGQSKGWEFLAQTLPGFEAHFSDQPPWESCCLAHDKQYWPGKTEDGFRLRKQADEELRQCIAGVGDAKAPELSLKYSTSEVKVRQAFSFTADFIYLAVRLGGQPCSLLPWRWGYGWDSCAFASISDIPEVSSNVKFDEHVSFFDTAGWLDTDTAEWLIPIHAWIYEPQQSQVRLGAFSTLLESRFGLQITPENEENFRRRSNLLIADNERGKILVIRLAGQDFPLPASTENGHISTLLRLPAEVVHAFSDQGRLNYFAVMQNSDKRQFQGQVELVPRQGLSVISDIDDTIKISDVTDQKRLLDNTFLKDFRPVSGMPELYRSLADRNVKLHFVSSSPWQLYDPLREFMRDAGFPWATMRLKYLRFRDESLMNLFKKGTETKPAQIEPILRRYPEHRFILVGDSGEQDPEVYGDIARRYPAQIHRILIRNVDNSEATDMRYQAAFSDIAAGKWRLFTITEEISIGDLLTHK